MPAASGQHARCKYSEKTATLPNGVVDDLIIWPHLCSVVDVPLTNAARQNSRKTVTAGSSGQTKTLTSVVQLRYISNMNLVYLRNSNTNETNLTFSAAREEGARLEVPHFCLSS
jgi:hypothetical protein